MKKESIIEVASELFSKSGYRSVSMSSIAKKLKITKPALYYHFKNKEELYMKAINNAFEKTMKEMQRSLKNSESSLTSLSMAYLRAGQKRGSFSKIASYNRDTSINSDYLKDLKEKILAIFEKNIIDSQERKLKKKRSFKNEAVLLVGLIDGLMMNVKLKNSKIKEQIKRVIPIVTKVEG